VQQLPVSQFLNDITHSFHIELDGRCTLLPNEFLYKSGHSRYCQKSFQLYLKQNPTCSVVQSRVYFLCLYLPEAHTLLELRLSSSVSRFMHLPLSRQFFTTSLHLTAPQANAAGPASRFRVCYSRALIIVNRPHTAQHPLAGSSRKTPTSQTPPQPPTSQP
jgi:hypothetical protein